VTKERPILFNGAMVRAILSDQKTQTRRAIKNVPSWDHLGKNIMDWGLSGIHQEGYGEHDQLEGTDKWYLDVQTDVDDHSRKVVRCPFGQPGDRLWVRESFWGCDMPGYGDQPCVVYDNEWIGNEYVPAEVRPWARKFGRIPAIHMPRDASRLLLEVTAVRVERLQALPEADWEAEGISFCMEDPSTAAGQAFNEAEHYAIAGVSMRVTPEDHGMRAQFAEQSLDWDSNPWVWVIEFKVLAA
jgi:hypothetical protein